jgi:hypothetical protein
MRRKCSVCTLARGQRGVCPLQLLAVLGGISERSLTIIVKVGRHGRFKHLTFLVATNKTEYFICTVGSSVYCAVCWGRTHTPHECGWLSQKPEARSQVVARGSSRVPRCELYENCELQAIAAAAQSRITSNPSYPPTASRLHRPPPPSAARRRPPFWFWLSATYLSYLCPLSLSTSACAASRSRVTVTATYYGPVPRTLPLSLPPLHLIALFGKCPHRLVRQRPPPRRRRRRHVGHLPPPFPHRDP